MRIGNLARAAIAVALTATAAQAQINGTLNFSGTVRARSATLPGGGLDPVNVVLDFDPFVNPNGFITVSSAGNTGSFAIFNTSPPAPPVFGTIKDITVGDGGAYNVPDFVQVPIAPLYSFDLLSIAPGSFSAASCFVAPAAGQTCTPAGNTAPTVFNLANTLNAVGGLDATVSFNVAGIVRGPGNTSSPYSGTFTAQFPGMSYQELLTTINTPGGSLERSFSATLIATAVPEPSTYVLMGSGLLAIFGAGFVRRRNDA